MTWEPADSNKFTPINPGTKEFGYQSIPEKMVLAISVGPSPVWVSAQELQTSLHVNQWVNELSQEKFLSSSIIDTTLNGRAIPMLQMGTDQKDAIVIISRQHPPEVTGYLCMKAFVEEITGDSKLAKRFRKRYGMYVFPLMNPDGVDEGHWRHNYGGIDLNRDWANRHQPETSIVHRFLQQQKALGKQFHFAIDFHSTWDDIYYPIDSTLMSSSNNELMYGWLSAMGDAIPDYTPNIKPSKTIDPPMISSRYFVTYYDMPALVFELGDNTPRDFLAEKGKVAAQELMKLLLDR